MWHRLFGREESTNLRERLFEGKAIKVQGVRFKIRKIQVLDYIEGARVLHEIFATYRTKGQKSVDDKLVPSMKKAREYMRDVIMAGVIEPKLVRKQEDDPEAILVDEIFNDWILAQELVSAILAYTYGKKK